MNSAGFPLLSLINFLPLLGAMGLLLLQGAERDVARASRWIALGTSLITFAVSLLLLFHFNPADATFQLMERREWVPGFQYIKGIDGISLWFVLGSTLLVPICILASWKSITARVREFMIAMLILEVMMVGIFTSLDLILVFVFFEGVLLPMFFLIGIWGGKNRIYSSYKFFLYTMLGSLFMLLGMIMIYLHAGTTDVTVLLKLSYPEHFQRWLWLAFFVSFAVKSPMWPFHTWLPYAHTEAPTAGSAILAGILLKMGGYGLLRFNIQMLPEAGYYFTPLVMILSVAAIILTSLIALAQKDMKKMIAYSSVAHMGFVTIGLFSWNFQGLDGAMFQMLSHTVVSAALFLCIGIAYDRHHTRELGKYGGLASITPNFALVFMIFTLGAVGLPGTSGFVGEFLSLAGTYQFSRAFATLAAIGVILGAAYMLVLYRAIFYGAPSSNDVKHLPDLNSREILYLLPLIVLVFWMGIYPATFKNKYTENLEQTVRRNTIMLDQAKPKTLWNILPAYSQSASHLTEAKGS